MSRAICPGMKPFMKVRRNRETESEQECRKDYKSRTSSKRERAKARRKTRHRSRRMRRSILFARTFCFLALGTSTSEIVRDCAVEAATLAKLRRAYSYPAAVAQLVDLVQQVHDIEADDH